jgi:hypothetical protein
LNISVSMCCVVRLGSITTRSGQFSGWNGGRWCCWSKVVEWWFCRLRLARRINFVAVWVSLACDLSWALAHAEISATQQPISGFSLLRLFSRVHLFVTSSTVGNYCSGWVLLSNCLKVTVARHWNFLSKVQHLLALFPFSSRQHNRASLRLLNLRWTTGLAVISKP